MIGLTIVGSVLFDRNHRPRKERFFKNKEMLPKSVIISIAEKCSKLQSLQLDRCVLGPHFNTAFFPENLDLSSHQLGPFIFGKC